MEVNGRILEHFCCSREWPRNIETTLKKESTSRYWLYADQYNDMWTSPPTPSSPWESNIRDLLRSLDLHLFFFLLWGFQFSLHWRNSITFFFVKYKGSPSAAIDVNSTVWAEEFKHLKRRRRENAPAGLQMLSFLANSLRAIKHVTCFQVWLVFFLSTLTLHSYSKYDCLLNLLSRENVMQCFGLDIAL